MENVTINLSREDAMRLRRLVFAKLCALEDNGICPGEEEYAEGLQRVSDAVEAAVLNE